MSLIFEVVKLATPKIYRIEKSVSLRKVVKIVKEKMSRFGKSWFKTDNFLI